MSLYSESLKKEGMAETRSRDLAFAMEMLHSAISKLDDQNKTLFWSKDLTQRMRDFASIEELNTKCLGR